MKTWILVASNRALALHQGEHQVFHLNRNSRADNNTPIVGREQVYPAAKNH